MDPVLVQAALLKAGCPLYLTPLRDVEPASPEWWAIQLCAIHGLIEPEVGWYRPEGALTRSDFLKIIDYFGTDTQVSRTPTNGEVKREDPLAPC